MTRLYRLVRLTSGLILALCGLLIWTNAAGNSEINGKRLYIVVADQSEDTHHIVDNLQKRFPTAQIITEQLKTLPKHKANVFIAVGPPALRALLSRNQDGLIVSTFTSSHAVKELLESAPNERQRKITGIYADPSIVDQLQLIFELYKRPVRVSVIVHHNNSYLALLARQAITHSNTKLFVDIVPFEENINRTLDRMAESKVLLAIPDKDIYKPGSIRNILITTYRRDQAVVGFSVPFVKAGALATTYSDIDDILDQLEELLRTFYKDGNIPEMQFPKYFETAINDNVARSLNLVIDNDVRKFQRKISPK